MKLNAQDMNLNMSMPVAATPHLMHINFVDVPSKEFWSLFDQPITGFILFTGSLFKSSRRQLLLTYLRDNACKAAKGPYGPWLHRTGGIIRSTSLEEYWNLLSHAFGWV